MRLLVMAVTLLWVQLASAELPAIPIIAYHDVRDSVALDYDADQFAISTRNLIEHFAWLRQAGYQPISIDQLVASIEGAADLPERPVILTFDDGLASVYERVFPLLELFDYPAVISVVTSWIDRDSGVTMPPASNILTWDQIREMQASGLIEVATHTHDLHHGILGNPQGNELPAAVTRRFDGAAYENEHTYRSRISADLATSIARILKETGGVPRTVTWPFGAFNDIAAEEAAAQGLSISLTLEPSSFTRCGTLHLGRHLIASNPNLTDFSAELTLEDSAPVIRVAQVDLDYVYDEDPVQQGRNLDRLLDRIKALKISHVYLQAFADFDGDGGASETYFPNRHLPMRADLFNRVAWQLKTRADVRVYAWMPMLSFVGEAFDDEWRVRQRVDDTFSIDPDSEPRLSPFSDDARQLIGDIYEDLAIHARFDGILFHDDARLSDIEDFSRPALEAYEREFGPEVSLPDLVDDATLRRQFGRFKTQALIDLSNELTKRVRKHLPAIRTARNLFASAILDAEAPGYLAQDYDAFLANYDHVALMAMPQLEWAADEETFYEQLIQEVSLRPDGLERTIFELQTIDWRSKERISTTSLSTRMRWLQSHGVRNIGYYPDDFVAGHPELAELRRGLSLSDEILKAAP